MSNLKYHHLGIPTDTPKDGEAFLEKFGMYVVGFDTNPYGIEWIRFTVDSKIPKLVQSVPHVAFETDDLLAEIEGKEILIEPNSPSEGVTVAFIVHNGAPVEFLEYKKASRGDALLRWILLRLRSILPLWE